MFIKMHELSSRRNELLVDFAYRGEQLLRIIVYHGKQFMITRNRSGRDGKLFQLHRRITSSRKFAGTRSILSFVKQK